MEGKKLTLDVWGSLQLWPRFSQAPVWIRMANSQVAPASRIAPHSQTASTRLRHTPSDEFYLAAAPPGSSAIRRLPLAKPLSASIPAP